jgi:predicted CXXCH cytochrome family protein
MEVEVSFPESTNQQTALADGKSDCQFLVLVQKASILLSLLVFALSPAVFAVKHPVPLEKDTTDAKCVECHEDKTKGKVVHPAVQMGCSSCHFLRSTGDDTRIVLKNARPATLCLTCHSDKQTAGVKAHVHAPARQDCLKCHNPHVSENKSLLLKSDSGDKDSNLCLSCHTQGLNVPEKGSRHAALDMGCETCHVTHKTGERGKQEFDFHLTKATPALCIDCHDPKDAGIAKAHQGQPIAAANCINCHDPHQSSSPKLLQANLHAPFEAAACDTCHAAPKDGKVVLTQPDSRALCLTCHEEVGKKMDAAKVAHPGAQGECVACHNPHGGKKPKFVDTVSACTSCHTNQADALAKKAVLHDPAFNQSCNVCHTSHGGDRDHLLRAEVDDLCLTCHGPDAKALKGPDGKSESIFAKTIVLPAGYLAKSPHIELTNARLGHPVPSHPVSGTDPRDKNKKISCISCHDPHAGEAKGMLLSKNGSQSTLCGECHENMKQEQSK